MRGLPTSVLGMARQHRLVPILGIVTVAFAARCLAWSLASSDWDQGVYLVMAQQWLRGGLPYVAVWDQHPPGLPALLALTQLVIADPVVGAQFAATSAVAATSVLMYCLAARFADSPGAGLLAAGLYIICISRWLGLAANTEIFNNLCVTFAAFCLCAALRRERAALPWAAAGAAALGLGLQIKYVVLPEAVTFCLTYLIVAYHRRGSTSEIVASAIVLLCLGCAPTALAIGYFWSHGALRPYLDANIGSNLTYLGLLPPVPMLLHTIASGLAPIIGAGALIALAGSRAARDGEQRPPVTSVRGWLMVWSATAVADICLPLKFFDHYFFALYPPVCLAGALVVSAWATRCRLACLVGAAALFVTAIPTYVLGVARSLNGARADGPRIVAAMLRQAGARDGEVFVYNYTPAIYALAGLRPPTPYVLGAELATYSASAHVDGPAEVDRIMNARPRFIVLSTPPFHGALAHSLDAIVADRLRAYELIGKVEDGLDRDVIETYERCHDGACASGSKPS